MEYKIIDRFYKDRWNDRQLDRQMLMTLFSVEATNLKHMDLKVINK